MNSIIHRINSSYPQFVRLMSSWKIEKFMIPTVSYLTSSLAKPCQNKSLIGINPNYFSIRNISKDNFIKLKLKKLGWLDYSRSVSFLFCNFVKGILVVML